MPLPDSDSANALCARTPALRPPLPTPTGLTCPLLRMKGGAWRVAAGARGLGGCRVPPLLITPLPRSPPRPSACPPHTPSQGERPATNPGSLHFASALQRGRCSTSTRGRRPGGLDTPPRVGVGAPGTLGPSSLAPNRFWAADLGPTGWLLVANEIWGRVGGTPSPSKIDSGWTAQQPIGDEEGGGPRLVRPLSFALCGGAGHRGNLVRGVTGTGSPRCPHTRSRGSAAPRPWPRFALPGGRHAVPSPWGLPTTPGASLTR